VLSIGSDPGRDYDTLLRAWAQADIPATLRIVTRRELEPSLLCESVRVSSNHSQRELRELFRGARFVVLSLFDIDQPSGQSAALQAMACGKAVVISRTRGLWEPENMRDGSTCRLFEPGDVAGLAAAMRELWRSPESAARIGQVSRELAARRYTVDFFARCLERHIEAIRG